jgi:hypothetical protein
MLRVVFSVQNIDDATTTNKLGGVLRLDMELQGHLPRFVRRRTGAARKRASKSMHRHTDVCACRNVSMTISDSMVSCVCVWRWRIACQA